MKYLHNKKLKIGSAIYDIEMVKEIDEDDHIFGQYQATNMKILISTECAELYQKLAFLHETVHGMLDETGEYKLNGNEGFVDRFSRILYQVLTDNKEIFNQLIKESK